MAQNANNRLELARLHHRFGFGPKPGEFEKDLLAPITLAKSRILTNPQSDLALSSLADPVLADLGNRPKADSPEIVKFGQDLRAQNLQLTLWWLDRMVLADNCLAEKMTWFWHGHWATSIKKVNYPLSMYRQNQTLRINALGNFRKMTKEMVNDGALQVWLDGPSNTFNAPNENLARELMELFTIGVNNYTEEDVKAASRALTGYQVVRSTGQVFINQRRRDLNPVTILGTTNTFSGDSLTDLLVDRVECQNFIAERIWFRFISSTLPMPKNFAAKAAFASREISPTIQAAADSSHLSNPSYELVKSPVEWFVSVCRALELIPSQLQPATRTLNYLEKLGQVPFDPPTVGGWPAGAAWLTSATSLHRLEFANWLIGKSRLATLRDTPAEQKITKSLNWLGINKWSDRTKVALTEAINHPPQFTLSAICSPEYVVNA
ncbi:MAG: DUF1800 family protein [Actinobacteria bacterium]|nr:DUF1800 family protein [Actinomycetota bacterium]NBQ60301.1 DUF1800 family protein [Actinomycetota bacterium]NCA26058.1 DUF1800 family protein [Actinomycetota bacterium]NCU96848.1 DUF1800 family protein [Actinomycetota bacterium]NCZ76961.1 DUF1800 family protein [Actinomycetota bacterium]